MNNYPEDIRTTDVGKRVLFGISFQKFFLEFPFRIITSHVVITEVTVMFDLKKEVLYCRFAPDITQFFYQRLLTGASVIATVPGILCLPPRD